MGAVRPAALALALSLGCASAPSPPPTAPAGPEVLSVEIEDGLELDTGALAAELANHPPSGLVFIDRARLDALALEIDRRRIESFYREEGYFAVEVSDAQVVPDPEGVILKYVVEPGAPSSVVRLDLDGAPPEHEAALRALLELRVGEPFRYPAYVRDKERLREQLFRSGYARVVVSGKAQVARVSAEARVTYVIETGPRVRFGKAKVTGKSTLPQSSILARVDFEPGDPFDPEQLEVTERRAYELSLLGSLRFELDPNAVGETADVEINIADAQPNELRIGVGVGVTSTQYELAARAAYTRRHFFHPLLTFRSELRPSVAMIKLDDSIAPNVELFSEIQRDDFLIPRLAGTIGTAFELNQYELYTTVGPSVYGVLSRPLFDDHVRASLRIELELLDLNSDLFAPDLLRYGFYDPQATVIAVPALTWDERDDGLSPRRGTFLRIEAGIGRTLDSGAGTFVKITPDARVYLPVFTDQLVFAARLRAGASFSSAPLPVNHRYFAGGSESQRGFGRRLLSPDVLDGRGVLGPVGGEAMVEGSVELRFDLFKLFDNWFGVVAFADAADVTESLDALAIDQLHLAIGPGIRYRTPIGPLRFDLGFRMNRTGPDQPAPDDTWTFHFSLGEAF